MQQAVAHHDVEGGILDRKPPYIRMNPSDVGRLAKALPSVADRRLRQLHCCDLGPLARQKVSILSLSRTKIENSRACELRRGRQATYEASRLPSPKTGRTLVTLLVATASSPRQNVQLPPIVTIFAQQLSRDRSMAAFASECCKLLNV